MKPLFTQEEFDKAKSIDKLYCECYFCDQPYLVEKKHITIIYKYGSDSKKAKNKCKFCSKKCSNAALVKKITKITNCINCGCETHNAKFCSKSCSNSYHNKTSPKRRPEGNCKNCNKNISTKFKFCSQECREEHMNQFEKQNKTYEDIRKTNNKSVASYRRNMKTKAIEYKGGRCMVCGYNKCEGVLSFHHLNPKEKDFKISSGNTVSWERLKPELDKCVMLCMNCHTEVHAGMIELFH